MTTEELARRLITLIFAGRNRMDMIRRELPRTKRAGWVRKPFRIELEEGSPFRGPCAVIGSAVQKYITISDCLSGFMVRFGVQGDSPHEAEQFAAQRRHDLILVLAADGEGLVTLVQPVLRFPGNLFDFVAERQGLLSSEKEAGDVGPMLVGPGSLHQNPSQMGVAGLGNRTSLDAVSAGMFP